MLLNQPLGSLIIFLLNLVVRGHCERLESPKEIRESNQERDRLLSNWDILFDYIELEIIRRNIVRNFPQDDFYFVGNPLAYVGLEMVVRRRLVGSFSGIIRFVPFSGNHIDIIRNSEQEHRFTRNTDYPTHEKIENYKKQLRLIGLDPKSIVKRYETSGNRTVIVKDVGVGLVSFLDILCDWAKLEGISPNQLRIALKVFGVIFEDDGFPNRSVITIGEYSIDMVRLELTSVTSLNTMRRIAYPERNTGYVRFLPNYPSQLWNELPMELDQRQEYRLNAYVGRLTEVMRRMVDIIPLFPPTPPPTLRLRSGSNLACRSRESRFKRDLSNHDLIKEQIRLILTSDKDVLKMLQTEHENSPSKNTSPLEFIESQLKNSSSIVSEILIEACDGKYNHYSIDEDETVSPELVNFSSNKTEIFECMVRYKLFQCSEFYDSSGVFKIVANLAVQRFFGAKIAKQNVEDEVTNLIRNLVHSYPKFFMDFVAEATAGAALYCSEEKIVSVLECPSYDQQYLGQTMFAWFVQPFEKTDNVSDEDF